MGQKVNPISFRLGQNFTTKIRGYIEKKDYLKNCIKYLDIQKYCLNFFGKLVVSDVIVEKSSDDVFISLISPKPGIIIAKKGEKLEQLQTKLVEKFGQMNGKGSKVSFSINIIEVRKPELDVNYVAADIAQQIEKRMSFKRVMNRAVISAMKSGAKGVKVQLSGRLNGAEIARTEKAQKGALSLHTIKSDINYALAEAHTSYGVIGVKVWIYLGDIHSYDPHKYDKRLSGSMKSSGGNRYVNS